MQTRCLSVAMVQRLHAIASIPIFLTSCFSVFCFFGGKTVGYLFFKRLILDGRYIYIVGDKRIWTSSQNIYPFIAITMTTLTYIQHQ